MKLYTIGFTGKSAEEFFRILGNTEAKRLIDIRINRKSQLAGFSKENDLKYFLSELVDFEYVVNENLAPTKELLSKYRNKEIDWTLFENSYKELIAKRGAISNLNEKDFSNSVLLCSEASANKCHRRILGDMLKGKFDDLEIINL